MDNIVMLIFGILMVTAVIIFYIISWHQRKKRRQMSTAEKNDNHSISNPYPIDGENLSEGIFPSVNYLICPICGGNNLLVLGEKGSAEKSKAADKQSLEWIANAKYIEDSSSHALCYKCKQCKNIFNEPPHIALPNEIMLEPCTINFTRLASSIGSAVSLYIYLNGIKVGIVKNGETIAFKTNLINNTVVVTDCIGRAFKSIRVFQASPKGIIDMNFMRKFV